PCQGRCCRVCLASRDVRHAIGAQRARAPRAEVGGARGARTRPVGARRRTMMSMRLRWWVLGFWFVAASLAPSMALAAPWSASGATVRGDFDGDGEDAIVVSSPEFNGNKGIVYVIE